MGKTDDKVLDPTRSEDRASLEADDFKGKPKTGYEVRRFSGERVYFSDDKADAEARLVELAGSAGGIGVDGEGEPVYLLSEVRYVEVENFDPKGPESRTRGKRDGSAPAVKEGEGEATA